MSHQDFLIKQSTTRSVSEVIDQVEKMLHEKGVKIFSRISHSQAAADVGISMPDEELIIFGNPKVGTALMLDEPAIGIELPLKVIAWREGEKTIVAYHNLAQLAQIFSLAPDNQTIQLLTNFMSNLVGATIK